MKRSINYVKMIVASWFFFFTQISMGQIQINQPYPQLSFLQDRLSDQILADVRQFIQSSGPIKNNQINLYQKYVVKVDQGQGDFAYLIPFDVVYEDKKMSLKVCQLVIYKNKEDISLSTHEQFDYVKTNGIPCVFIKAFQLIDLDLDGRSDVLLEISYGSANTTPPYGFNWLVAFFTAAKEKSSILCGAKKEQADFLNTKKFQLLFHSTDYDLIRRFLTKTRDLMENPC